MSFTDLLFFGLVRLSTWQGICVGIVIGLFLASWARGPRRVVDPRGFFQRVRRRWFLPAYFIGAVAAGFFVSCLLGRKAASTPAYKNFNRFHAYIDATTQFYTTASQLRNLVTQAAPAPGKTLVLIGGSSVLNGVGQNPGEEWTRHLQRLLGDRFAVVNLGVPGGLFPDFGALVYQMIWRHYPGMVFVADTPTYTVGDVARESYYDYLVWDAYYKGLLDLPPEDLAKFREIAGTSWSDPQKIEDHLRGRLDSWVYACDLWSFVTYRYFSTVWTPKTAEDMLRARRWWPEDRLDIKPLAQRLAANYEENLRHTRGFSDGLYDRDSRGAWVRNDYVWRLLDREVQAALPKDLRSSALVLLVWNSPYFIARLTPDEQQRNALAYAGTRQLWEKAGYGRVLDIGRGTPEEEIVDRIHFTAEGGRRLAEAVAAEIRALANQPRP